MERKAPKTTWIGHVDLIEFLNIKVCLILLGLITQYLNLLDMHLLGL
ncbi:D-ribose pyranase [Bienertia sinuspersici]